MNANIDKATVGQITEWLGAGSINIFGWPFSGKDTQGKRLTELLGASLIGGGDILRNSDIPSRVREIMDRGELIPTEDYIEIVTPYLSKPEFNARPIIMSSLGRWFGEQVAIVQAAEASGHPVKAVVNLILSEEIALERADKSKRLADRGERADDASEYLSTRFDEFRSKTLPVIDYYRQHELLIDVDGSLTPDQVTGQIIEKLHTFSK